MPKLTIKYFHIEWTDKKALNLVKYAFYLILIHQFGKQTLNVIIFKSEAILKLGSVSPSVTVSSFR